MSIVSKALTRSNLEWASIFIGFAIIWMVSGLFVEEPAPPALIEKKDAVAVSYTHLTLPTIYSV